MASLCSLQRLQYHKLSPCRTSCCEKFLRQSSRLTFLKSLSSKDQLNPAFSGYVYVKSFTSFLQTTVNLLKGFSSTTLVLLNRSEGEGDLLSSTPRLIDSIISSSFRFGLRTLGNLKNLGKQTMFPSNLSFRYSARTGYPPWLSGICKQKMR